ncbi:MAG: hypothetical protein HC804_02350 [Anaerolineae bacterium]|nr:hypothetical protein [Anaerolineae bacterium]
MHTVDDITGRGRYLIETGPCLISTEVLMHPSGQYTSYTDVSRSIPLAHVGDVVQALLEIAAAINWLNARQHQPECVSALDVMGTAV